jgi:hypothetical protein
MPGKVSDILHKVVLAMLPEEKERENPYKAHEEGTVPSWLEETTRHGI